MAVYTVGNQRVYDKRIRELGRDFLKIGRTHSYPGGFAVSCVADARKLVIEFGRNDWAVYELEADWDTDTTPSQNGWWHALVNDSVILRRVDDD